MNVIDEEVVPLIACASEARFAVIGNHCKSMRTIANHLKSMNMFENQWNINDKQW